MSRIGEPTKYSLFRAKIRFWQAIIQHIYQDESECIGHQETELNLTYVAPRGEIGETLVKHYIEESFRYSDKFPTGETYKLVEFTSEPIDHVITLSST